MDGEILELYEKVERAIERTENRILRGFNNEMKDIKVRIASIDRKLTEVCVQNAEQGAKIAWLTWGVRLLFAAILGLGTATGYMALS